ncbi:hypothetical protein [Paenibacillus medicaginis]|uniref:Uncharacterized protein n=1 Tax=Paenibacillus medicaginis TaxID=1470560 RepID=A0ABV5C504_9BACL
MRNVSMGLVTANGIEFEGLYYSCQLAIFENWFDMARVEGDWKILVVYNTGMDATIEVFHTPTGKWVMARNIPGSAPASGHAEGEHIRQSLNKLMRSGELQPAAELE